LELDSDDHWVTASDRLLHTHAATTGITCLAIVKRFILGTTIAVVDNRRSCLKTMSGAYHSTDDRYDGGTMEPYHVDNGMPAPPDSIRQELRCYSQTRRHSGLKKCLCFQQIGKKMGKEDA